MGQREDRPRREGTGTAATWTLRDGWTAAASDDETRRAVVENRTDDVGPWHGATVPGEWRSIPEFADHAGAVAYRTHVPSVDLGPEDRLFAVCEGIFDQADLWYDGAYIGDQDDPFLPGRHEFGDLARLEGPGMLVVEVNGATRAGPWLPVSLRRTGPVAIEALRILCRDANEERAHLLFTARLDASRPAAPVVRTRIDGHAASERVHRLSRGANTISWTVDVDRPSLWWPRSRGEPRLTEIAVEVDLDGVDSDVEVRRTGIRQVSMDNWLLTVNGERIFAMGAHLDAYDDLPPEGPGSRPVDLALDAGLNLLRVRRHVAHPGLYAAADEAGLLVWQDVPPRPSGRARSRRGRRRAERVATGLVDLLGHHPSIVLWHHDVADAWTHRALVRADPTRSALSHLSTAVPSRAATDPRAAVLRGALAGVTADLAASIAVVPNISRFPVVEQWRLFEPGPARVGDAAAHLRTLRTVRFRPAAGFCHLKLQDSSVLDNEGMHDHAGRARDLRDEVRDACAPVIVAFVAGSGEGRFGIVVVNDSTTPVPAATVTLEIDGSPTRLWQGDAAADDVTWIAEVDLEDAAGRHASARTDLSVAAVLRDSTGSTVSSCARTLSPGAGAGARH